MSSDEKKISNLDSFANALEESNKREKREYDELLKKIESHIGKAVRHRIYLIEGKVVGSWEVFRDPPKVNIKWSNGAHSVEWLTDIEFLEKT